MCDMIKYFQIFILQPKKVREVGSGGSIIQASKVVVKNIPKYGIAGGHPAIVFKYRNIEHYTKLKNEKKFH